MPKYTSADEILTLIRAFQPACVLFAAAELNVFTAMSGRPITAPSLSEILHADIRSLTVLLDVLTALGFLIKDKDKYRVPGHLVGMLTEKGSSNILPAIRHQGNCLRRWAQLGRVIQSGRPAICVPSIRGRDADLKAFIGAMDNFSLPISTKIIHKLQPLKFRHLLDVGGASGTWTIAFLRAVPHVTATLFDLPDVIPLAAKRLTSSRLTKRVSLVAGDYNRDRFPTGSDFAWLSAIAHQNSRRQNRALFDRIFTALSPGGIVVIRDVVMDESRTSPSQGAFFAVNMLVGTRSGGTYTFDEFRQDLSHAGFTGIKLVHHDLAMNSLIRARKPRTKVGLT